MKDSLAVVAKGGIYLLMILFSCVLLFGCQDSTIKKDDVQAVFQAEKETEEYQKF